MGAIKRVQYLVDGSTRFNVIHGSKRGTVEHSWATFTADKFLVPERIVIPKKRAPEIIKCPKCGMKGRVNEYHPRKERVDVTRYYVKHEYLGGYWGKTTSKKIKRFRRCYFNRDLRYS